MNEYWVTWTDLAGSHREWVEAEDETEAVLKVGGGSDITVQPGIEYRVIDSEGSEVTGKVAIHSDASHSEMLDRAKNDVLNKGMSGPPAEMEVKYVAWV